MHHWRSWDDSKLVETNLFQSAFFRYLLVLADLFQEHAAKCLPKEVADEGESLKGVLLVAVFRGLCWYLVMKRFVC